jgi:DNA-binding NarL/FixJ family response regulator
MIGSMTRRISSPTFVGRRAELDRLDQAFGRAAHGEPSVVLVAGEAGVGKSRLMAEFAARVAAAGGHALAGGCLDLSGGGQPYAPFAEALRLFVRRLDADARAAAFGPSTAALVRLVPDLRALRVGADPGVPGPEPSGAQAQVFDGVIGALEHISSERPLAFIVEDIHWADGTSRDLVRFLVRNLDTQRVTIVATYRSDDLHRRHPLMTLLAELERSNRVERLDLACFDREELSNQLEGILGEPATAAFVEALLERSNGIPFYVEELVAGGDGGYTLPTTLREILGLRLAALSNASLAVVRAAAIVGARVPHDRLVAVTELKEQDLLAALGEAVDARILIPTDTAEGPFYAFRHALVREAAAEELLPAERVRLHLRLADHLDAVLDGLPSAEASVASEAAAHAYEAHDLPRALSSAVRAIHALVAATAYREALGHAERALELWLRVDHPAERAGMDHPTMLALASQIAAAVNQPKRAVTLVREAIGELESSGEEDRLAAVLADLYMLEWEVQDFEASTASARRAFELVKDREPSHLKFFVTWMMGWARWWDGRLDEAVQLLEAAMKIADAIGDRTAWADASGALAHTLADLGYATQAAALADRSAASLPDVDGGPFDGRPMSLWVVPDRSIAWWTAGRFGDAATASLEGLEQARRYGWEARLGGDLRACAADALFEAGRYNDVEAVLEPLLAGGGIWNSLTWARQAMARVAIVQGRLDDAERHLDGLVPIGSGGAAEFWDALVRVELARAEGRFGGVLGAVEAGLSGRSRSQSVAGLWALLGSAIGACADRADMARSRRRPGDAREASEIAEGWLETLLPIVDLGRCAGGAGPFIEATVAMAEAEALRVRGASDPDAWRLVTASWLALGHPYQTSYAGLRYAGAIMASKGDRSIAGEALRDAYETASAIGAASLIREINMLAEEGRLDVGWQPASPVKVARDAVPASPSLTTRERGVLRLVAEGHTNREIGARLFISEKTVSVHVSNAMAKLGALSRYEAAASSKRLGLI